LNDDCIDENRYYDINSSSFNRCSRLRSWNRCIFGRVSTWKVNGKFNCYN